MIECSKRLIPLLAGALVGIGSTVGADRSMSPVILPFPEDFNRAQFEELLHPDHPRLFATEEQWQNLRAVAETSPALRNAVSALRDTAEDILEAPPEERVLTGVRLLSVSREVLRRTLVLGTLYRLTEEERYFERAREELLAAAAFEDWNPSHFLDTAEMTLAVAIGYDWFHHKFSGDEREGLRRAIVRKGLEPGTESMSWKTWDNNWNQVCFAGLVAGALAVGDHEPDLAVRFLRETFEKNSLALDSYRPDGAYPEGPVYWNYGTHFQVILLSVLQSALGETWELENYPAFQESAVYINLMIGPSGKFFSYADGRDGVPPMPALHWFAAQAQNPQLDARERERLITNPSGLAASAAKDRIFPLVVQWFDPSLGDAQGNPLPLHWRADGPNPVAVHRSSEEEDALFLGIKGGSPSGNHGHMDIGSFVLDWRGIRWGVDLGMQGYESLESRGLKIWNRDQEGDRWRVFRMNTWGHNTLVIDGQAQRVDGFAPISAFSGNPGSPFTVVDMTAVYRESLERALRGARLLDDETVLIHDRLTGLPAGASVRWGMVTPAEVELGGGRAVLRHEGEELHAQILSPDGAEFEIVQTDPPPNDFDARNPGTRMLAFFAGDHADSQDLRVVFSGEKLSVERIRKILSQPPPEEWE